MDALLIALLLTLLVEAGGRLPPLYAALKRRYEGSVAVTAGMIVAMAANAAIGAMAGGLIASMLSPEARNLFWALALAGAAGGLLWRGKGLEKELSGWRVGALPTSALGLFLLGFGEAPAFLIAGIAASRADPWMAGIGGTLGGVGAMLAMGSIGKEIPPRLLKGGRIALALFLLLCAFIIAMNALRLTGSAV